MYKVFWLFFFPDWVIMLNAILKYLIFCTKKKIFMQRHMQTISFIAIMGVLLSLSFLFSQLTNVGKRGMAATNTPVTDEGPIEDLPMCTADMAFAEKLTCYGDAVEISQRMLDAKINDILALEPESNKRIAIVEANIAWENSRDADCSLLLEMETENELTQIDEMVCLRDQNLARIEKLDEYLCQWYQPSACRSGESVLETSGQ